MSAASRALVLVRRPDGPSLEGCFAVERRAVPTPLAGQVVVRVEWLGIDATQRGWLNEEDSYVAPVDLGSVMRGAGVGTVVASARDDVPVGTVVSGDLGWQDHAVMSGDGVDGVTVVPPGSSPATCWASTAFPD